MKSLESSQRETLTGFVDQGVGFGHGSLVAHVQSWTPLETQTHTPLSSDLKRSASRPQRSAHHAGVEVLLHATERVGGHLPFAGEQQGDVGDAQRVKTLRFRSPSVRQENPVSRGSAAGAQVGRAAVRSRLDDVPARFQLLLPLIQDPERKTQLLL